MKQKNMKKTIAIGDVHGLTNWKDIVFAEKNKGNRFVFMGDYVDPYSDMKVYDLMTNMIDLLALKHKLGDDCILLLGNHDMHYINKDFPMGTRYDERIAGLFNAFMLDYRSLFQYAYQEGKTIYTHAGISNDWWEDDFLPHVDKSAIPMRDGVIDVAAMLNNANDEQLKAMFQVGYSRGGSSRNGGIFWADKDETSVDPLKGFSQVVGHSRVPSIHTYSTDADTQITYCDCLETGVYHIKPS